MTFKNEIIQRINKIHIDRFFENGLSKQSGYKHMDVTSSF